jgi:hypothetical protein
MTWLEPLRDPANDARLAAILSEPGLSAAEAARLLAIIRAVVDELVDRGLILPELTPRSLVDLARLCHGKPADDWQRLIAEELGQSGNQAAELDRLTAGPWVDAAKHLWAFLHPQTWQPPAGSGLVPIQEEVLPGVFWRPVLHSSGPRARPLLRHMLEAWEVGTESVRAQASRIVLAYEHVVEPWPDPGSPLRIIRTRDREAEWLGLLLHRLPDACPAGHVVAIPFRSGAIHLPLDAPDLLAVLPRFASLAAGAFREASQYNDQLCRSLFWLQPDGTPLELFDLFKVPDRPTELPEAFLVALASQQPTSRRPT